VHRVPLNRVVFSAKSDGWRTPREFFTALDREFLFVVDAAAKRSNALCDTWFGPGHPILTYRNALTVDWWREVGPSWRAVWCNPPYSACREFVAKAAKERLQGVTSVLLVPARTDTQWWHAHVWDRGAGRYRPGVKARYVQGRLMFLKANGKPTLDRHGRPTRAPFPSVVIVFKGVTYRRRQLGRTGGLK